jgi:hypothetical protein
MKIINQGPVHGRKRRNKRRKKKKRKRIKIENKNLKRNTHLIHIVEVGIKNMILVKVKVSS